MCQLFDAPQGMNGSQVLSSGAAFVTRIGANMTSTGTVQVHAVQGYATMTVQIINAIGQPIVLTGSPAFGNVSVYQDQPVTVTVSTSDATVGAIACTFYIDGQLMQAGGTSYVLNPNNLRTGENYRLDVTAFSSDGSRAGSNTWQVFKYAQNVGADAISGIVTNNTAATGELYVIVSQPSGTTLQTIDLGQVGPNGSRNYQTQVFAEGQSVYVSANLVPAGSVIGGDRTYLGSFFTGTPSSYNDMSLIAIPHSNGATYNISSLFWLP